MRRFMTTLDILKSLAAASIRAQMQYRANFLMEVIAGIVYQGVGFAFIWAVLQRFSAVGGWSLMDVALLYGIRLTAHGIYQMSLGGMMLIDNLVRSGDFDRYVLRPLHPLLQIMTLTMRMSTLGDLVGGLAVLLTVLPQVDVAWTPTKVVLLLLTIPGAALIESALLLVISSMAFTFLESWSANRVVDDVLSNFGNYPLQIFQKPVRWFLTFVLPMAFIAYIPACNLLDRPTYLPLWTAWLVPVLGIALVAIAIRIFSSAMTNYQSAGN